ncbi:MAG: hypothetical protein H8E35_04600 [Ardenticatenia bacterium]|nr:hypothetical protein [Ardenticatenia bacterium]
MFRRLLWPMRYLGAWWQIDKYPRDMAVEQRQNVNRCCLQVVGAVSERAPFTADTIGAVPQRYGVYRIYENDQLRYVGRSRKLRTGLRQHRSAAVGQHHPKPQLGDLICSGQAQIEWYTCPRGLYWWMECYDILELDPTWNGGRSDEEESVDISNGQ